MAKTERKLFKDYFDQSAAKQLAQLVASAHPDFDRSKFVKLAVLNLEQLEMQDRVWQFADSLAAVLPNKKEQALQILINCLPAKLEKCEGFNDIWILWPIGHFIARYGIDHFEKSFEAMVELTQRFSAEFAVRPFVERYPGAVSERFLQLTDHPNPHVRRWCSEGIRPLLPWGKKLESLVEDPSAILPILEKLKDDPELYVRRSVANTLNDISKHHPKLVTELCQQWITNASSDRVWLIKHALRTLLKSANPEALLILGYGSPKALSADFSLSSKTVRLDESIELECNLRSSHTQKLMVDYVVHFVRKNGKFGEKVFKWKNVTLSADQDLTLNKKHTFKLTTVRALYLGLHKIELQINGVRSAELTFNLEL